MESFRSQGTTQDVDKVTKAGQGSFDQAGKITRGHAEAHAQIRSSRELGNEWSCETMREILSKTKDDPEQGIAGVQKDLSIQRDRKGQRSALGDCRDAFQAQHAAHGEVLDQ